MIKKLLAVAALAVGAVGSANAALATLSAWDNSAYVMSHGLVGVNFNTAGTAAQYVAIGAHPYQSGTMMPNDGNSVFWATAGQANATHPSWTFDFAFNTGGCTGCTVFLDVDLGANGSIDRTVQLGFPDDFALAGGGFGNSESIMFSFLFPNFNANSASSTGFTVRMMGANGAQILTTSARVDVPEPTSLALVGVALAGLGFARRRKAA